MDERIAKKKENELYLPLVGFYNSWTVSNQNQKYAYDHGTLILLILLADSYR